MNRDFEARARRASANLRAAVDAAEMTTVSPVAPMPRRSMVVALRPALIVALLTIGSAVGVALVNDNLTPGPAPLPPVIDTTTTTIEAATTTSTEVVEASPSTSVAPAAVVPSSTSTTEAADTDPPLLEITAPDDEARFEKKNITFEGKTEPGARVFRGKFEADVDSSGRWTLGLVLAEGKNVVTFSALDDAGNEAEASVTVYYDPPTTTTTVEKELAKFKAHATYGSCSETPPYDIYYGTGEPGSLVEITSEYGSGAVEVDGDGNWEKKVVFESAPPDKVFVVTVSDEFGRSKQFEMIYKP